MNDFKLNKSSLKWFISEITSKTGDGNSFRVSIKQWRDKRSLNQNSLYHKWLAEISKQAKVNNNSFNSDTWHEYFKRYFCPKKTIQMPAGEPVTVATTTKLDKGEFTFYLMKIEAWAMEKGFYLTIPENCEYANLIEEQDR